MRKVDYYVGIPMCFVLTFFNRLISLFNRPKIKKVKKVLFIELSEMGSTILTYSAFRKVKQLYPYSSIYFLIFKKNRVSIDVMNIIPKQNVLTIDSSSLSNLVKDCIKLFFLFRRLKFDLSYDLELFSRFTAILSFFTLAKQRVGFSNNVNEGLYRGDIFTKKVWYNPYIHISGNFLNLVYSVESNPKDKIQYKNKIDDADIFSLKLKYSKLQTKKIKDYFSSKFGIDTDIKTILVNADGGLLPIRAWPIDNYIVLLKNLCYHPCNIVLTGVGKSAEKTANIILSKFEENKIINLTNKTSFQQLIDLFHISDALITNDGGPAHFATLTDIKIFTFFGPETPVLYAPLSEDATNFYANYACSPCLTAYNHRKTMCKEQKCLKAISVDYVYNTIKKVLKWR